MSSRARTTAKVKSGGSDLENIGYEIDGKSREFTRPVIVLKKYNQYSFLAAPLTTTQKPNPYRLPIGMVDGKYA